MSSPRILIPLLALVLGAGLWLVFWPSQDGGAEVAPIESGAQQQRSDDRAEAQVDAASETEGDRESVVADEVAETTSEGGLLQAVTDALTPTRKVRFSGWVMHGELPIVGAVVYAYSSPAWGGEKEVDAFNKDTPFVCNREGYFEGEMEIGSTIALQARAPEMEHLSVFKMQSDAQGPVEGIRLQMAPRQSLFGQTLSAEELPLAGVEVQVELPESWSLRYAGPVDRTTYHPRQWPPLTSGVGGEFSRAVPESQFDLSARHEVHGRARANGVDPLNSPHRLVLDPPEGELGYIWSGVVYHADGSAAANAQVNVQPSDVSTRADQGGYFEFENLKEHWGDKSYLTAWAEGSAPGLLELGKIDSDRRNLRLDLPLTAPIAGVVVDAEGEPMPDTDVYLSGDPELSEWNTPAPTLLSGFTQRFDTGRASFRAERALNRSTTDGEGRFRFEWVPAGDYYLSLASSIFSSEGAARASGGDEDVRLVVGEFPDDLVTFKGVVRDRNTGEALAGLDVVVWKVRGHGAAGIRYGETDANGRYELTGFVAGEYYLQAKGAGFAAAKTAAAEYTEGSAEHEILVFGERKVVIRVTNAAGERLQGIHVGIQDVGGAHQTIWSGNGSGTTKKPTNAQGEVVAHRMPGCPVTITLSGRYREGQQQYEQEYEADFSLDQDHIVELTFDNPN